LAWVDCWHCFGSHNVPDTFDVGMASALFAKEAPFMFS